MSIENVLAALQKVKGTGKDKWIACCPAHKDTSPSLSVGVGHDGTVLLHCFAGCTSASIMSAIAVDRTEFFPPKDAPQRSPRAFQTQPAPIPTPADQTPAVKPQVVATWQYHNRAGETVYEVQRLEPGDGGRKKTFRQRRQVAGAWVYNMEGVERVLYGLPEFDHFDEIWIAEGERKADALRHCGFCGTCNVGGAGKWLDGYTECLAGKNIVLIGDNDEPGQKHVKLVHDSLVGKVATVRIVNIPSKYNDVVDYIADVGEAEASKQLAAWRDRATVMTRGIDLPILSMEAMEQKYVESLHRSDENALDLSRWLPSFRQYVRKIVPGEVITILAETGAGKTMCLQNIALNAAPLNVLFFEMELPDTLTFERFAGIATNSSGYDMERIYLNRHRVDWRNKEQMKRIYTCTKAKLTPTDIEMLIERSELIIGQRPAVVCVDYIQLVRGAGKGRRERIADAAEELKQIAKATGTIIIQTSQVMRKPDDAGGEIFLTDAKEAGEIENSSGLVIGVWRDPNEANVMLVRSLKNTKGRPMPDPIRCQITESLVIRETTFERSHNE